MQLTSLAQWATIIGSFATAGLVLVAVFTYLNSYFQRQAEDLWDLLFDCQRDFRAVYKEFDQQGMAQIVGRLVGHKGINDFSSMLWENRDKTEDEIKELIKTYEHNIRFAIIDTLSDPSISRLSTYSEKFQLALYKIRPRCPVLYEFLRCVHSIMNYSVRISQEPGTYYKLVTEGATIMKVNGDLEKQYSAASVNSFLFFIIVANLQNYGERRNLNDLFDKLDNLMSILLETYREVSHFALWRISRKEGSTPKEKYVRDKVTTSLKDVIDMKQQELGNKYGDASNLVGQATLLILETEKDNEDGGN